MKLIHILLFLQFLSFTSRAQDNAAEKRLDSSYYGLLCSLEEMKMDSLLLQETYEAPVLKGQQGSFEESLIHMIYSRVEYPQWAMEEGLEGEVYLQFRIEKDASVKEFKIIQAAHPTLDKLALEAVRSLQFTSPAKLNGEPITRCLSIPVQFSLR